MLSASKTFLCVASLALMTAAAQPAADGVQAGIVAWQQGDHPAAVAAWRPLAEAGNADAQFNLGQAYRLGRGVTQDLRQAEQWFERAARQRHEQAGTNLGLLLFQNGRAREAMPWIQAAALRGDPRAQYVFGTALFNGDIVRRDLPRAYAMMSAAAAQNFPQADAQLREMDRHVPQADREQGRRLALEMGGQAPTASAPQRREVAQAAPAPARPSAGGSFPVPDAQGRPPREAVAVARVRPDAQQPAAPRRVPAPAERPTQAGESRARPAPPTGGWRVQLGAFSSEANARRQWEIVRRQVRAVAALSPTYVRAGSIIRLRAGPLSDRAAANQLCAAVRSAGQGCIPTNP